MDTTMDRETLGSKLLPELQQIAQTMGVEGAQKLRKAPLIDAIVAASTNGEGEAKPSRSRRPAKTDEPVTTADAAPTTETADEPMVRTFREWVLKEAAATVVHQAIEPAISGES